MNLFETARLTATKLSHEDLADLVTLHLDPEVSRFLGGVRTEEATADYVDANLRHWNEHGVGLWTLRTKDGAFAGRAGLRYLDLDGVRELEIAYTFVKSLWGQGFGTEIAKVLVAHWETGRMEPSLIGVVIKGNAASEAVLVKSGFDYERDCALQGEVCRVYRRFR